jgi:hypothetical protein
LALEVNGMHALHRPNLPRVLMTMTVAVALAILLSLAITSGLGDGMHGTSSGPASSGSSQVAVHPRATGAPSSLHPFTTNPFNGSLTAPIATPWRPVVTPPDQTRR